MTTAERTLAFVAEAGSGHRPGRVPADDPRIVARARAGDVRLVADTSRELQVMALVEQGRSNAEIAALLWLSPGTVRKHLENVYAKLSVRNRTAAVPRLRRLDGHEPGT